MMAKIRAENRKLRAQLKQRRLKRKCRNFKRAKNLAIGHRGDKEVVFRTRGKKFQHFF